jgi:hypothetical protein
MGKRLATAKAAVSKLDPKDVLQIAAELRSRILSEGNFEKEPQGILGLTTLAEHHPQTRAGLLALLKSLPAETIGGWPGQTITKLMSYPETAAEAKMLAEDWKKKNPRIAAMLVGAQPKPILK